MLSIRKAVIPAAGFGTRHLPITKAVPKEMLPILDRPAIDYVIEECVQSGITEICIVVSRGKEAIADYLDSRPELESALIKAEKSDKIKLINPFKGRANFYFVRQREMRGTAKAVELCREFTADEDFAVLFPDDVIYSPGKPVIGQLIDAYRTTGASIVGVQRMPAEKARDYGVVVPSETKGRYTRIKGFIEKPAAPKGRLAAGPGRFQHIKTRGRKQGRLCGRSAFAVYSKRAAPTGAARQLVIHYGAGSVNLCVFQGQ